jgi:hypothetical protein
VPGLRRPLGPASLQRGLVGEAPARHQQPALPERRQQDQLDHEPGGVQQQDAERARGVEIADQREYPQCRGVEHQQRIPEGLQPLEGASVRLVCIGRKDAPLGVQQPREGERQGAHGDQERDQSERPTGVEGVEPRGDLGGERGGQEDPAELAQLRAQQPQTGFGPAQVRRGEPVRHADAAQQDEPEELPGDEQERAADRRGEVRGLGRHLELPARHRDQQRPGRRREDRQPDGEQGVAEVVGGRLAELGGQTPDQGEQAPAHRQQPDQHQGEQGVDGGVRGLVGDGLRHLAPTGGRQDPPHLGRHAVELIELEHGGVAHPQQVLVEEGGVVRDHGKQALLGRLQLGELGADGRRRWRWPAPAAPGG